MLERVLRVRDSLQAKRACAVVTLRPSLARRILVGDSRLSRSCQRALPDGVGGGQPRVANSGESTGITGSLERYVSESSLSNSDNSSMGVACVGSAPAAVAPLASVFSSPCPLAACDAGAVHTRRTVSPMHANAHNSWSDTVSLQSPRRGRGSKRALPVRPKICALSQGWRQG